MNIYRIGKYCYYKIIHIRKNEKRLRDLEKYFVVALNQQLAVESKVNFSMNKTPASGSITF